MKRLIALAFVTCLYACNNEKKTQQVVDSASATVKPGTDSLTYTYDSVKVYGHPSLSKNKLITDTAKSVIAYPVFSDHVVNKFLEDRVISMAGQQGIYKTYKELTTGFIKEFTVFQSKNKEDQTWFQNMDLSVIKNYPNYLSVLYTYMEYKGGAHPNTLFTYINYNPKTYQTITLDSLITPEGMPKLRAVAEQIFRKNEKLSPQASLSKGYFFAEGVFSLAETFTVSREGLKFLYNPYEIKPYAAGLTELIVPFSAIKDILKPSSILVNFK